MDLDRSEQGQQRREAARRAELGAIDLALEDLKGGSVYVILRAKLPIIMQTPKGGAIMDNPVQFDAETSQRCGGDGWTFTIKERDAELGGLSTYRLTVR